MAVYVVGDVSVSDVLVRDVSFVRPPVNVDSVVARLVREYDDEREYYDVYTPLLVAALCDDDSVLQFWRPYIGALQQLFGGRVWGRWVSTLHDSENSEISLSTSRITSRELEFVSSVRSDVRRVIGDIVLRYKRERLGSR